MTNTKTQTKQIENMIAVTENAKDADTESGTQDQVTGTQEPKIPKLLKNHEARLTQKSLEDIARKVIPLASWLA